MASIRDAFLATKQKKKEESLGISVGTCQSPPTPEHEPPPMTVTAHSLLRKMQVLKKKVFLGQWRANIHELALALHICESE